MLKEKGVNIGKGRIKWKLDCWLQMNVVIHKILSFQILGQIYHKNWLMKYKQTTYIYLSINIFFSRSLAVGPAQQSREWGRLWHGTLHPGLALAKG